MTSEIYCGRRVADKQNSKFAKLQALRERFARELPSRFDDIEKVWQEEKSTAQSGTFYRLVHSLAGAAGTFGFSQLGDRARDLELLLQQLSDVQDVPESIAKIDQAIAELRDIAQQQPAKREPEQVSGLTENFAKKNNEPLIYLLEDDKSIAEDILNQLKPFNYRVEMFSNSDALYAGVAREIPDVFLADINLPEGADAGPQAVAKLRRGAAANVPVVFISGYGSWQNRLNAIRAGGQAYLTKPINMIQLFEQLDFVLGNQQESALRILIVDDTPLLAEHYANVLGAAGMQTEALNDPSSLLDVLPVFCPDLVLMDIYMPGCSGIEAAQIIRQHSGYTNLPIVYLSTERGVEQQLDALRVGGDDFLQKPINDSHLVKAVKIRARRFRELTALMTRDGLTGLYNHINLKLMLEREISQAQRRSSPLSFVMLDIDHFKLVNDKYGHPTGDAVIKSLARLLSQRLRKGDIAARYGGEEFAVVLPDTKLEDAYLIIDNLRKQFFEFRYSHEGTEFNVTISAGIATCPPHQDMTALIAAADNALYQAKHGGRNQVVVNAE